MLRQRKNKFTVTWNYKHKERDSINSKQPFLKSHPLWVTLYIHEGLMQGWNFYIFNPFKNAQIRFLISLRKIARISRIKHMVFIKG